MYLHVKLTRLVSYQLDTSEHYFEGSLNRENAPTRLVCGQYHTWADSPRCYKKAG